MSPLARLVFGFAVILFPMLVVAGDGVFVRWAPVQVSVPTLGTYGPIFLAAIIATILWRNLSKRPQNANLVFAVGLAGICAGAAVWVSDVRSGGPTFNPGGALSCTGSQSIADDDPNYFRIRNDCSSSLKVNYDTTESVCDLGELQCQSPPCVADGEVIPSASAELLLRQCFNPLTPPG